MSSEEPLIVGHYCVSFIDLLGLKDEFEDQDLLPRFESAEEKAKFINKLRNTLGRIKALQRASDRLLKAALEYRSPFREKLQATDKRTYDQAKEVHLTRQRWSDGLVYFTPLMDGDVKCPINGVYTQLVATGGLCFLGLAVRLPLRGSIDVAWAAEMNAGELYGAAVAKAYELENRVAQYPRIVVGPRVVDYIIRIKKDTASDVYSEYSRRIANLCYDMLALDSDGYHFVHYLSDAFHRIATGEIHQQTYQDSMKFIVEQCERWSRERNTKLAFRYNRLLSYFVAHPPPVSQQRDADASTSD
jgi:hypothetical protein